ncbi:MAG: TIGR00289 family protein [Nitrososphaerota archaeon]|nr:TIGR00289 family protein [Candidatus Bathyarchaeota archaeon]MDW8049351.1 TIGR00289 family protein [Nitrososphaerota archaeon]
MRVAALISGGKDSSLALYRAIKMGLYVECLATVIPKREDSLLFHYPNINLTSLFAKASGIPLKKTVSNSRSEKEEINDLKNLLRDLDVEGVVSGVISSSFQKQRIDRVCWELGLESITPLWQVDPMKLMNEIVSSGFDTIITGVYAYGLGENWLGRKIDEQSLKELVEVAKKFNISLVGEGGEYETFVTDAPFFNKRIRILEAETFWKGCAGSLMIKQATLVDKR